MEFPPILSNTTSAVSSFIGGLNPTKLAIEAAVLGALCGLSFISGCVHKEHSYAAEQLRNVQTTARIEKQDAVAGVTAGANFTAANTKAQATTAAVITQTTGKPLVVVKWQTPKCSVETAQQTIVTAKEEPKNDVQPQAAGVFLTFDAIRLYDVSITGLDEFPAGTDGKTSAVQVDEAFRQVVNPNAEQCRKVTEQLSDLLNLITKKQEISARKGN